MSGPVVVTYLELGRRSTLRPARRVPGARVERVGDPAVNARLYREIGAEWSWTDRLGWPPDAWRDWAARVETCVLRAGRAVAGFYELDGQDGGDVELAIFGLRAAYRGRGLGGHLLTDAAERAWARPGTRRVWVHTCTLDGPHALANYRARGFVPFKVETSSG